MTKQVYCKIDTEPTITAERRCGIAVDLVLANHWLLPFAEFWQQLTDEIKGQLYNAQYGVQDL